MSDNRTARNEAWITSLVLHVALLAGVIAVVGRPRETADGPVVVNTRDTGHEIGVVMLDRPAPKQAPGPISLPDPPPPAPVEVVPPPPPQVSLLMPSSLENETLLRWFAAEDPALVASAV